MKRLLKQQEQILQNYQETDGAKLSDYYDAINQHLRHMVSVVTIVPEDGNIRNVCENNLKECVENTIDFKSIDGAFCSKCGEVYPF